MWAVVYKLSVLCYTIRMEYLVTFVEGLASFISPCSLPLLPVYIAYFATSNSSKASTFLKALFFSLGFTVIFSLLGLFAGSVGVFLNEHYRIVNIVTGSIIILFGISYLFDLHFHFFKQRQSSIKPTDYFKAFLFGLVFALNVSPCIGVFLGSALMLAGSSLSAVKGCSLLFVYSLGLSLPFLISSLFLQALTPVYNFIKRHYKVVNIISATVLITTGILIICGVFSPLSKTPKQNRTTTEVSDSNTSQTSSGEYLKRKDLFTIKDANNNDIKIESKFGKPIFVNFWASWCGPCKSEFPEIEKAFKEYGDKIEFMLVNLTYSDMGNIDETIEFISDLGYTFPLYFDLNGSASSKFNISGIPYSVFYNSNGTIAFRHTGAMNKEILEHYLNALK